MKKSDMLKEHIDEIWSMRDQKVENREIAEHFGVSLRTLSRFLSENGFVERVKFTEDIQKKVIDEYVNQKISIQKIASKYHKDPKFISEFLRDNGVEIEGTVKRNRIYSINESFFETIDTEEKAYVLGFLLADGAVVGNQITVSIQEKDKKILEDMLDAMDSGHPLFYVNYRDKTQTCFGKYHSQNQWKFQIKCKKMVSDLARHGVVQNKSLKAYYPETVPDSLFGPFLRGLFDGDGYICKTENRFQLTGCDTLLRAVLEKLKTLTGVTKGTISDACDNGITKNLRIFGKDNCKTLFDFIYKDATIYLDRKYQVYLNRFYSATE